MKKFLSCLLALMTLYSLSLPALASEYTDVADGVWYADAVTYVTEHRLMDAKSDGQFAPEENAPRSVVAEALWRVAGKPLAAQTAPFSDVTATDPNKAAIDWAAERGIINGYDGAFHGDALVTREQFAAMLWRSVDRPDAESAASFADTGTISDYAVTAAAWSQENNLINGMPGNLFAPKANITRAMVATILMRYDQMAKEKTITDAPKVLVAYFSCTGSTEKIATHVADALGVTPYRVTPETPYTSADLNYNDGSTRATREQNDSTARPAISGTVENMADYDVIFLGYPIWWGQAPKIMYTFVESYDLAGKTIVPFCTSGSSGIGSSATNLSASAPSATWLGGNRFSGSASRDSVANWINGLGLDLTV